MLAVEIVLSYHTPLDPYKVTLAELVQSSGTDITLDSVLTILDEHYNNVKALDALNQELFQMRMADKETSVGLGHLPLPTFTDIGSILS